MVRASVIRLSMRRGLPCVKLCAAASAAGSMMVDRLDEYEKRMKDVHQKGTAKTRMKSFKIDNARFPFDTMIKIQRKDQNGMDLPSEYVQFLCYVLELYFTHKDLLVEYFQNLQENIVHKNE